RLLLSRLHRGLARGALGEGHTGLQQGTDRALWPEAARLGRGDGFDLSPVRSERPAPHGVPRLSRGLRRHPVRGNSQRFPALLSAHDAAAGRDAARWRFRRGRCVGSSQEVSLVPRSAAYVALLVALGSFGPLTMSIYTPVMPSVGTDLGAGAESVKLTLTTYMVGFALGQLLYGPL